MILTPPKRRWPLAATSFVLGSAAALGLAPFELWQLTLLGFAGGFWLLSAAATLRGAVWTGWTFGTGYFAVALFWIVEPFLVDIPRHGWMAPFALLFISTGFALFWAAAFWIAAWVGTGWQRLLAAVLTLTLAELARGVVLTGFPWALIGHVWVGHDVMQLAAWGGAGLLTAFTLFVAALPWLFRSHVGGALAALALLGGGWAMGAVRLAQVEAPMRDAVVRVIQPNAPQHLKWDPAHVSTFFNRQIAMSAEPADAPLAAIVWPETSLTTPLGFAGELLPLMDEVAGDVPLIFGANDVVEGAYRNAFAILDGAGFPLEVYHKHHLVPFGEYIPLGELLGGLGLRGLAARDGGGFASGPGPRLLEVEGLGKVLPLICYELIFPRHLRTETRPDVIVQITNDAWFGNISGPYQHLAQARLRAVEQGIGVIRSANTGVSAVIDAMGRVTKSAHEADLIGLRQVQRFEHRRAGAQRKPLQPGLFPKRLFYQGIQLRHGRCLVLRRLKFLVGLDNTGHQRMAYHVLGGEVVERHALHALKQVLGIPQT